jgi:hypothetical protein
MNYLDFSELLKSTVADEFDPAKMGIGCGDSRDNIIILIFTCGLIGVIISKIKRRAKTFQEEFGGPFILTADQQPENQQPEERPRRRRRIIERATN